MKIQNKILLVAVLFGAQSLVSAAEGDAGEAKKQETTKQETTKRLHIFSIREVADEARNLNAKLVGVQDFVQKKETKKY